MFGYVRPLRGELKVRTLEQFQADYCGLCRSLGKRFGFAARFTVSYDLLLLYLILSGMEPEAQRTRCRCPARPWRCRACAPESDAMTFTAAANVIFTYEKLSDALHDERGFRKLAAGLGKVLLRGAKRKADRIAPELAEKTAEQMSRIWELEQSRDPVMDRHADAFAQMLCACSDYFREPSLQRPAKELLLHVGRYLYLVDALEDLKKDAAKGRFNPLLYRFDVRDGILSPEDLAYLKQSVFQSLNRAEAALDLLPLKGSDELLHNIICLGLPAVLQSVADGSFRSSVMKMRRTQ